MLNFENDIAAAVKTLLAGGIILYPTDTVWGIGCDATNPVAVDKIMALKNRPANKSMIVLVAEERDIIQYVAAPDPAVFVYLETIQKPTTVVYPQGIALAENLLGADGSIGIRICADEFCRHLIKRLRHPLVSTSANVSGQPTPTFFNEIADTIKDGVDYVVEHRRDDLTPAVPSSVIKWTSTGIEVLRP